MNTTDKTYDVNDVIEVVRSLASSQGFYGRLLEQILYLQDYEPWNFEEFKRIVEEQNFKDPVDVVLFFES